MNDRNIGPALENALNASSRAFRLGMEAMGNESLAEFIDTLAPTLTRLSPDNIQKLSAILNESLQAQHRRDYSYLADLLDFQIRPLLNRVGTGIRP